MRRFFRGRTFRLLLLLAVSWSVMTVTHEAGHLVGGWLGGGNLVDFELLPWRMPYSLFDPDPHPLLTLWAGPVLGVLVPLCLASLLRRRWGWFIASFCTLANGVYLALSWISGDRYLDAPRLLERGASPLAMTMYCLVTIGCGYLGFRHYLLAIIFREKDSGPYEKPA